MHEYARIRVNTCINMHKYAFWVSRRLPGGHPSARLSPPMGTKSDFESILSDFRGPSEIPFGPRGDQFSASTRLGRANETEKGTQSSDCSENRVQDGPPEEITVPLDLHFMLKLQ